MKRKYLFLLLVYILIVLIAGLTSSCSLRKCNEFPKDIPENVPLDEFILGTWLSDSAIYDDGKDIGLIYEIEFVDKSTVKIKYYYPDGRFGDGETWPYRFLDGNTIYIENLRITGGQTWFLERNSQNLIINDVDSKYPRTLKLSRGSFRCDYIVPIK